MTNSLLKKYTSNLAEIEKSKDLPEYFWVGNSIVDEIPILLPFKNSKGFIYDIGVNVQNVDKIISAMEYLAIRTLLNVENGFLKITIIDLGYGATFQNLKKLNKSNVPIEFITDSNQLDKFLTKTINTSRELEDNILAQQGLSHISEFNQFSKVSKPYQLIFIPNFPIGLNNQQLDKIKDLILYASKVGVIFILGLHHSELSRLNEKTYNQYDFSVFTKNMQRINVAMENQNALFNINPTLVELISNRGYKHLQILNEVIDGVSLVNKHFAKTQSETINKDFLNIPIGYDDNGCRCFFTLGQTSNAFHTLISGTTGSGKTSFTHNIIQQIAENYSSDQIRLYLFDYKESIEFDRYRNHPNVELLHLDNDNYDMAIDTLRSFEKEIKVRKQLFQNEKTSNIYDYNKISKTPIHYKIMIIDEFHRIFKTDAQRGKEIANLLDRIATQGRGWGLHLIIISQTFNIDRLSLLTDKNFNAMGSF